MIKKYLKKFIALGIIATSVLAINPVGASAEEKVNNGILTNSTISEITTVKVKSITLNQRSLKWTIGKTGSLIAKVAPSNATNKELTWKSSNINVAAVDAEGKITAIGVGNARITCIASDGSGKSAISTITVSDDKIKVKSITLNKKNLKLEVGKTDALTAKISPVNALSKEVTWTSSNPYVVTVDATGKVIAIATGTATITCAANDGSGKSTTSIIKVIDAKVTSNKSIITIADLEKHLNSKFSNLNTPIGNLKFQFHILKNDISFFPYDFWIQTDYGDIKNSKYDIDFFSPFDLKYSIDISESDKEETKELLRNYQQNVAAEAMKYFPDKKIKGGFYTGFYKYRYIHEGYTSIDFLSWKNYSDGSDYADTRVTAFQWDDKYDDYDFTD